ncbi:hypothetical protein Taro_050247 [Colocasia esculenta]|uniref:Uncharacterized protein n=1 Tax=Colocasia esculenta TaxID=4460 RepID=A0A843XCX2_COLES|nr:hypothetical protein [Colocasia esculenta]
MSRCCFCIVFDSAGSAGVVFGPTLVVSRGVTLFRCFVVLCSRCFRGRGWHVGVCPRAGVPLGPSGGNAAGWLAVFSDRK